MKSHLFVYISLGLLLLSSSCKKNEIEVRIPESSIYLNSKSLQSSFNFANYSVDTDHILVDIGVRITGAVGKVDRSYKLVVQDSSSAVEGVDWVWGDGDLTVKKDSLYNRSQIRLLRHPGLSDKKVDLYLKLVPGPAFQMPLLGFDSVVHISFYENLDEPLYWSWFAYDYLGEYSAKKFILLQEVADMPQNALSTMPEEERDYMQLIGSLKRWGIILKRHIDQAWAAGDPILEENGEPMEYGEYM